MRPALTNPDPRKNQAHKRKSRPGNFKEAAEFYTIVEMAQATGYDQDRIRKWENAVGKYCMRDCIRCKKPHPHKDMSRKNPDSPITQICNGCRVGWERPKSQRRPRRRTSTTAFIQSPADILWSRTPMAHQHECLTTHLVQNYAHA